MNDSRGEIEPEKNKKFQTLTKLRVSRRRLIFYLVSLAALVVIYFQFSEIRLISRIFMRTSLFWLAGIIITQFFSHYCTALNYRDVLWFKGLKVKIADLFPVIFVIQFLNQTIPSATISGQIFFIRYLRKYGLSIIEGIGRAILEIMTIAAAFGAFFIIAVILLAANKSVADIKIEIYIIYIFFFISVLSASVFFSVQRKERGKLSHWIIGFVEKRLGKYDKNNRTQYVSLFIDQIRENLNLRKLGQKKRIILQAIFWQGMVVFLNILSLFFISFAIGSEIPFTVAFITFVLTKFISMIAFIPGGLGIFEGGMTLILISFNIPAGSALAITLLFRAFTFWLPMPIGWLLYRYYSHRQELENPYN